MFKVAIIRGVDYDDYQTFVEKCKYYLSNKAKNGGFMVVTTGDVYVTTFCKRYKIDMAVYDTDWKGDGKDALKKRNEKMLSDSDAFIIFDDMSRDTNTFKLITAETGKPVRVVK